MILEYQLSILRIGNWIKRSWEKVPKDGDLDQALLCIYMYPLS